MMAYPQRPQVQFKPFISLINFHVFRQINNLIIIEKLLSNLMNQNDTISQTRNSTQQPPTAWWKIKSLICPCLIPTPIMPVLITKDSGANITSVRSKTSQTNHSNNHYKNKQTFEVNQNMTKRNTKRKNSMQFHENQKKEELLNRKTKMFNKDFRETVNIQLGYNYRICSNDQLQCQVCNLCENVLLTAGAKSRQLLLKVSRVNITIRLALLKREIANKKQKIEKIQQKKYGEFQFNKHWDQRYILFQKFDQGIKIDENSWTINPPEQVSQYIANKCNGAKIVLDAFAGVGGNAIKLANINSCVKVIANQQNTKKMGFLLNNAKVYEVDSNIQLSQGSFLNLQRSNIDVVVVQPPLAQFHLSQHKEIFMKDFYPTLDKIILKSFKIASNMILLLPPQTNIDSLCNCINMCASELKKMKDFCSIKIQKIYCQMSIKYILVCIGTLVQTEVKLNDQLEYMYSRLKKPGEVYFKHKKVMKKLREDYGMLELFNLVKESQKVRRQSVNCTDIKKEKEQFAIDIFYELIRKKDLIPFDKLSKIIIEQDAEYQRQSSYFHSITFDQNQMAMSPMMQQEKIDENPFNIREAQLTQSQYSHYSYLSSYDKKSGNNNNKSHRSSAILMRERGEKSNPSIIINRVNDSKERNQSKQNSPLSPYNRAYKRGATQPIDINHEISEDNENAASLQ